jgi:hypothetical protein
MINFPITIKYVYHLTPITFKMIISNSTPYLNHHSQSIISILTTIIIIISTNPSQSHYQPIVLFDYISTKANYIIPKLNSIQIFIHPSHPIIIITIPIDPITS